MKESRRAGQATSLGALERPEYPGHDALAFCRIVLFDLPCEAQQSLEMMPTLRDTFGSVAGDLGFSEIIIQAMLGHGKRGVTQGYIHVDEALRHAVEMVSSKIADLLDGCAKTIRAAT